MDLFFWVRKYGIKKTISKRIWKRPYFLQDTVLTRWNRLIGCRQGHKRIEYIENDSTGRIDKQFCFACYREVNDDAN